MIRSRWLALVVLCAGMLMIILDQTIVTVALPSIQRDLGFSQSGLAWVVNAYVVPFGGLLLLAGRLGDLAGRKRVFVTGLALFTGASLWCGLAGSAGMLIAARFVQGIGGATTSAVILGMIVPMFPEPRERARAIAVYSFVGSAGATLGFFAGGVLTQALDWHWIFFVNLPIGLAAWALAGRLFPTERGLGLFVTRRPEVQAPGRFRLFVTRRPEVQAPGRFRLGAGADAAGAVLGTGGLMLGVYAIVGTGQHGWGSAYTIGFGAAAIVLLAAFVVREATAANPLLPLRVLRSRNVAGGNAAQALMVAAAIGFQFLSTLYLQRVLGYGPFAAGLAVVPAALAIGTISLGFSARLSGRFGLRTVLLAGLTLIAAGLALLARVPVDGRYAVDILPGVLLLGIGAGGALPAVTSLAMSGATENDSGLASGLVNTTQQIGAAFGLAVLATLAASRTADLIGAGATPTAALVGGYRLAFGVGAGLVVAAIVVALLVLNQPKDRHNLPEVVASERV
jgi:MFS family permease